MTKLTPIKLDDNTIIYLESNEDIDISSEDKNIAEETTEETRESLGKDPKGLKDIFSRPSSTENDTSEQEPIENNIPSIANTIKSYTEYTLNEFKKVDNANIEQLATEYDQILGLCENHKDEDYYLALCITHVTQPGEADSNTGLKPHLDRCPTWYHWISIIWWSIQRYAMFAVLYLMPILLFFGLEMLK